MGGLVHCSVFEDGGIWVKLIGRLSEKLEIRIKSKKAYLTWEKVAKAQEYYIFRKIGSKADFKFLAAVKTTSYSNPIASGKLYYYMVKSKAEFGGESIASKAQPAFINEKLPVVRHRISGDEGLQRFVGTWQGKILLPSNKFDEFKVSITAKGSNYEIKIFKNAYLVIHEKSKFAAYSRILKTRDIQMKLNDSFKGLASLSFNESAAVNKKLSVKKVKP